MDDDMSTEEAASSNGAVPDAPVEGMVACSMTSTLLGRTRRIEGQSVVEEIVRRAGVDRTPDYLEDIGNWIWYSEAVALFVAAEEVLGDEHIGRHVGEDSLRQHAGTPSRPCCAPSARPRRSTSRPRRR
jgi:hypothetical protein